MNNCVDIDQLVEELLVDYDEKRFSIEQFLQRLVMFFSKNPSLTSGELPIVHSIKYRLKDREHLRKKIIRKWDSKGGINKSNFYTAITDFAGIRVLHLFPSQFNDIHVEIMKQIKEEEWFLVEKPKAYTWDPETDHFFRSLGLECELKDSFYTSVHYLVSPKKYSDIKCEIQVRTLFEEIWGEIDHNINYPEQCSSIACREQLRVLSKLISTGSRLSEAILKSYEEHESLTK